MPPLKSNYKCSFCDYETHMKKRLDLHIRSHTKERPYKCNQPDCNSAFSSKAGLNTHQRRHKKGDESMYKYPCSNCPYKSMTSSELNSHLQTHSSIKAFSCDLCPYRSKQKKGILQHKKRVHLKLKPFKCTQPNCNFASSQISNLKAHEVVHKDRESLEKFKCDKCPYEAVLKRYLTRHLKSHSEVKDFACKLCPFRTKKRSSLVIHGKYVHSTLKPFKCPQPGCNYSCKQKSDLGIHAKVHMVDKLLSCAEPGCNFTTNWSSSLRYHEMIHRGERPFKCSLCPLDFHQRSHLNQHIRSHTGETPFPCPNCPYLGKSYSQMYNHLGLCKQRTNEVIVSRKEPMLRKHPVIECKIPGCGFLTQRHRRMAIHYVSTHNLPRVVLTKTKI